MSNSRVVTTACGGGFPEFHLKYNSRKVLERDVAWLVRYLENAVVSGEEYAHGNTLQVGWVVVQIREVGASGRLSVFEPDFKGLPIRFTESVTSSLWHLRLQLGAVESLGLQADFPNSRQSALCCSRLGVAGSDIFLRRDGSEGNDSGWFVGCADSGHDHNEPGNLKRLSLYELVCRYYSVVDFLAFPAGYGFVLRGKALDILSESGHVIPEPGSLLAHKYRTVR